MPAAIRIDHDERVIRLTLTDPLTLDEVLAFQDQQAAVGAWPFPTLADGTRCHWLPSTAEIRTVLEHLERLSTRHGRRGPVALVLPPDTATFGLARMYSLLAEPRVGLIEAFVTMADAERWLAAVAPGQ